MIRNRNPLHFPNSLGDEAATAREKGTTDARLFRAHHFIADAIAELAPLLEKPAPPIGLRHAHAACANASYILALLRGIAVLTSEGEGI